MAAMTAITSFFGMGRGVREERGPALAITVPEGGAMSEIPAPRNIWWVAMWSQDLRPGELLSRRIMNEPLVFYRTGDGRPAALLDRCAHRWAPLSRGKLVDDRLVCPYHGLEFDPHGVCVRNPHPNYAIPQAMRVRSYPVAEKHSLLWIWMGDAPADESLIPDFRALDPDAPEPPGPRNHLLMSASWDLIMDNLLDLSHVAYLHDGTLGNLSFVEAEVAIEEHSPTSITVIRENKDVPVTHMFDLLLYGQHPRVDVVGNQRWHAPACLFVDAGALPVGATRAQGTGIYGYHFLTPETDTTTHYNFVATRWNPISRGEAADAEMARQIADLRKRVFIDEDGVMIAAQQLRVLESGQRALTPVMLGIDAGVERVHRLLRQLSESEHTAQV
jgi:nitrite reductase/ring-hydroxylating ferredoxin subunit